MATIRKQCHDCGQLFMTIHSLLEHRMKKHGWKPVGSLNARRDESRARLARRSEGLWLSRFAALLVASLVCLPLADSPRCSLAEPIRPLPATALEPTFARDVTQPAIVLRVTPESPRAGTRVLVTVETVGLDPESGLNWKLPEVTGAEGESFESAAIVDDSGRTCQIVWPEAGEFPISVETLQFEGKIVPGGEGQPDRFVPTRWQIVTGKLTLKLRGVGPAPGPPPEPADDLNLPPVPSDLASAVQPVAAALAGHAAEAKELARVWSQIAVVVERGFGKTTPAIRQLHIDAARYTTFGALAGKIPGLGPAVDEFLKQTIGLEGATVDDIRRQKIAAAFRALARVAADKASSKAGAK